MSRYSCNLSGRCEPDRSGVFPTQVACRARCQSSPLSSHEKEMMFLTLSYNPEQALDLAPSDKVEYVWREYGIRANINYVNILLVALYTNEYLDLYRMGEIDYLRSELKRQPPRALDSLDFLLLEIVTNTYKELRLINWDYFRTSIHLVLRMVFVPLEVEQIDEHPHDIFRLIYNNIDRLIVTLYHVPSHRLDGEEDLPDDLREYSDNYMEGLKERYMM